MLFMVQVKVNPPFLGTGFCNFTHGTSASKFMESENLRPRLVLGGLNKFEAEVSAILKRLLLDPELELETDPVLR